MGAPAPRQKGYQRGKQKGGAKLKSGILGRPGVSEVGVLVPA